MTDAGSRSLLDYLGAPVVVGDPDGRAVYLNSSFHVMCCSAGFACGLLIILSIRSILALVSSLGVMAPSRTTQARACAVRSEAVRKCLEHLGPFWY